MPERPEYERGAILPSGWMVQGNADDADSSELLYVISLNTGKIGAQRKLFPMYALLLLTNLLEIHRVLAGTQGSGGGDTAEQKKQSLLDQIRRLTLES